MKKGLIIGLAVIVMMMMAVPAVLAIKTEIDSDPTIEVETTEATISWDGIGYVGIDAMVNDDASVDFETWGDSISGSLYLKDAGESYGVSSFYTNVDADVKNGFISYGVDRLDSYSHCEWYGPVDRSSYSGIESTRKASLALNVHSDYANLSDSGGSFVAKGEYFATHSVTNGIGRNSAYVEAMGKGTLDLHHERDTTKGDYDFAPINFGAGSYYFSEKSRVTQTGSGSFEVGGHFENSVSGGYIWDHDLDNTANKWDKTASWTATGSVDYMERFTFSDGFSLTNYSFSGD